MSFEVFRVERPREQTLPIVVGVPHAGDWIPDEVRAEMIIGEQVLRRDLDLYVDKLWRQAPELGATMVVSQVSRYVVDLNRAADDISPLTVKGGVRLEKPGYYHDRGVVWRTTTAGTSVMADAMSAERFDKRINDYYWPYHKALAAEIERVRKQFGFCILLDGHSMPSMGRRGHSDPGSQRAQIVPGDIDGAACDRTLRYVVEEHYREQGYSVKSNEPYKGGWITRHYGQPERRIHAIQIEVRRDLYMDEKNFRIQQPGLETLAQACAALIPKVAELEF
ncbi:MAG: N-formylglutamate amidohydrolase [Bradymonadaceae bacterium]|nr:N-formylglutamate amidohydrolase [Lujinxingiaceae bacterium]